MEPEPEDVQHFQVERIVDRQPEPAILLTQGEDQVLAHQVFGDQLGGVGRDELLVQIDVLHVVLGGQRFIDVVVAAQLQVDQASPMRWRFFLACSRALATSLGLIIPHSTSNSPSFFCCRAMV